MNYTNILRYTEIHTEVHRALPLQLYGNSVWFVGRYCTALISPPYHSLAPT